MSASYSEHHKITYFKISSFTFGLIACALPFFATCFCVIWSLIFDFKSSTGTHCGSHVYNFLPSISSAIGGYTPQRYVWRTCIGLHSAPRFLLAISYYNYHTSINVGQKNELYKGLAALCALLTICENIALLGLTYISSEENYATHEKCFIFFMFFGLLHMLLSTYVFSWGRTANGRLITRLEKKSLRYKSFLFITCLSVFLFSLYLFFRHNNYCESGVYTAFAACEFLVVFINIAFNGLAILDFHDLSFALVHSNILAERERKSS